MPLDLIRLDGRSITVSCRIPIYYFVLVIDNAHCLIADTIYACLDVEDDRKAGIRSSAVILGTGVYAFLYACAMLFVCMLALAGIRNGHSPLYFALTVGGGAAHLVWQLVTLDVTSPLSCRRSS